MGQLCYRFGPNETRVGVPLALRSRDAIGEPPCPNRCCSSPASPSRLPRSATSSSAAPISGNLPRLRDPAGGGAVEPVLPVRRAVLLDTLSPGQQHPRLAQADRRGRLEEAYEVSSATNNFLRSADASAHKTVCAKATASSSPLQQRHHRRRRTLHHRHRVRARLGEGRSARAPRAGARSGSSGPDRPEWPPPNSFAAVANAVTVYDRYDRVGGLMIYGIPGFKLEKTSSCVAGSCSRRAGSSSS